jgi:hypothetical protein
MDDGLAAVAVAAGAVFSSAAPLTRRAANGSAAQNMIVCIVRIMTSAIRRSYRFAYPRPPGVSARRDPGAAQ